MYNALPFSVGGLYLMERRGIKPLWLASREDSRHGDCQFGYQLYATACYELNPRKSRVGTGFLAALTVEFYSLVSDK